MSPSHLERKAVPENQRKQPTKNKTKRKAKAEKYNKQKKKQYPKIIILLRNIMQMKAQPYTKSLFPKDLLGIRSVWGKKKTITVA